jgi:protein-tyrosine kinase
VKTIKEMNPRKVVTDLARRPAAAARAEGTAQPAASVGDDVVLSTDQMVSLYRAIIRAFPDVNSRMVQVVSASAGEGVSTIVRSLAQAAATVGNAGVLICDATPRHESMKLLGVDKPAATLNEVASGTADLRGAIEVVPGHPFAICALADPGKGSHVAVNVDVLDGVFASLRQQFELIIVDAPQINGGPLGAALTKKMDCVILVVEAERTRMPVVTAAQRAIEVNGGRILGVVLNKRRFHVPPALYRWL